MSLKLLFVYNANAGFGNSVMDIGHKILSPQTYACSLCALTHGAFTEKTIWKNFRKELEKNEFELEFLHKNEFAKTYKSKFGYKFSYPIVLAAGENGLEILVHTQELEALSNVQGLMDLVRERVG